MNSIITEIIERLKVKIPQIPDRFDPKIYGILHLDIICEEGTSIKQIVLLIERLTVLEPHKLLKGKEIFADVYIKIHDSVLYQLAVKELSIDDAISQKMFQVYGDDEIWRLQLNALKKILPNELFEVQVEEESREISDDDEEEYSPPPSYPKTDLSIIRKEFKFLADAFLELQNKKFNAPRCSTEI